MRIFAVVEYESALLCIEVDDSGTSLLKTGKVVQVISTGKRGNTPRKPVAKRGKRRFRIISLQRYQSAKNSSSIYDRFANDFLGWIKEHNISSPIKAPTKVFNEFWTKRFPERKPYSEVIYGTIHAGWRAGFWEIIDERGHQVQIELKD